jgi:hypothetical protein
MKNNDHSLTAYIIKSGSTDPLIDLPQPLLIVQFRSSRECIAFWTNHGAASITVMNDDFRLSGDGGSLPNHL